MILYFVPVPERSIRREPFVLTFQTSRLTSGVACVTMVMPGVMAAGTGRAQDAALDEATPLARVVQRMRKRQFPLAVQCFRDGAG